jgi:hypothetical protein
MENIVYKEGDYPRVISGILSLNEIGGVGDIKYSPTNLNVKDITNNLSNDDEFVFNLSDEITYIGAFIMDNENKIYPASIIFDIVQNNKTFIINKRQEVNYVNYKLYLVEVMKSNNNQSISNIVDEIRNENMCYILNNNEYIYYWNILKYIKESN